MASRPPGASTRRISRQAAGVYLRTLRMPEPNRDRRPPAPSPTRNPGRVGAQRVVRDRSDGPRRRSLAAADAEAWRLREVDADDARGAQADARRSAAIARSAVPVQRSRTRSASGERQRADRALPPAAIDPGAQQMIEKIVARAQSRRTCPRCDPAPWKPGRPRRRSVSIRLAAALLDKRGEHSYIA